ncbi:hypothetical protein KIL84_008630 [Mauremys mutica]|uniref:Uncharacterized protein n=1 Tax=Mauremys mutica TaxID=74926 RepID=A0A9D3X393_9SAUR|nr:hypothetical protein KIL84_008630 [Mauremys mutica]
MPSPGLDGSCWTDALGTSAVGTVTSMGQMTESSNYSNVALPPVPIPRAMCPLSSPGDPADASSHPGRLRRKMVWWRTGFQSWLMNDSSLALGDSLKPELHAALVPVLMYQFSV